MTLPAGLDDFRASAPQGGAEAAARPAAVPHVVAWNLTQRCNLACAYCYIAAGPWHGSGGELSTDECRRIADEILALNPAPLFVLSGGQPLVRESATRLFATPPVLRPGRGLKASSTQQPHM